MKLTIRKDHLNEAIQHVARAISNRTTIPILNGVKLQANHSGLTLTASDTDISIESFIPLSKNDEEIIALTDPGSIVLPAKVFIEMVRKLPEQQVEIEVQQNHVTYIRSGLAEIQLSGLDAEQFPVMPALDERKVITLNSYVLKNLIRETSFAVSTNEATPILTGVQWTLQEGKLKFTATDRHRLSSAEAAVEVSDEMEQFQPVVISGRTLNELFKIIPDQTMLIQIVVTSNQVMFKMDTVLFYSRILDGTFPDTSRIIPQAFKTELVVNTKNFMDSIDRAYLLSREERTNIVKLVTEDERTVEISSTASETARVKEQLHPEHWSGESLHISFNSKYMLDVLKVIDSDLLQIGFTGAMSPIIIKPYEQDHMLHLILPYRTAN